MNLIINASPVSGGKIDRVFNTLNNEMMTRGVETELLSLVDYEILPCRGCLSCRSGVLCPLADDLSELKDKLSRADRIIIGTPVYWAHLPGQLKNLFDRTVPVFADFSSGPVPRPRNKGKKAQFLLSCGARSPFHLLGRQIQPAASELRNIFRSGGYGDLRYSSLPGKNTAEAEERVLKRLIRFAVFRK